MSERSKNIFVARYGSAEYIHKLLDSPEVDNDVKEAAINHGTYVNDSHLDKAMSSKNWYLREAAVKRPDASPELLHKGLSDESPYVREAAMKNPGATSEHVTKGLKDEDSSVRVEAAIHKSATLDQIMTGLKDGSTRVQSAASRNKNLGKEHVDYIVDHHKEVAEAALLQAMHSKHLSDKGINIGLDHDNPHMTRNVLNNPNITAAHIEANVGKIHPDVLSVALHHKTIDHEAIKRLTVNEHPLVAMLAVQHHLATKEDIDNAVANHPNEQVRPALQMVRKK